MLCFLLPSCLLPCRTALAADWIKKAKTLMYANEEEKVKAGTDLCVANDSAEAAETLCWALSHPRADLRKLRKAYAREVAAGNAPRGIGYSDNDPGGRRGRRRQPEGGDVARELALLINARMSLDRYAARALARLRSDGAVEWLEQEGLGHKTWKVRSEAAFALGRIKRASSRPKLEKLVSDKHPVVRSMAIDGLARYRSRESAPAILPALEDKHWQVQIAAIRALAAMGYSKAIGPLIRLIEREKGRLVGEVDRALQVLTGLRFNRNVKLWKEWYACHKEAIEAGKFKKITSGPNATVPRSPRTASFFGIPADSHRVLFIIDFSGSMRRYFKREREDKRGETRPKKGDEGSTRGKKDDEREGKKEKGKEGKDTGEKGEDPGEKAGKPRRPRIRVPGDTRIAEAKEQLLNTLYSLSDDVYFNVIIYSSTVIPLARGMLKATPANKNRICKRILGQPLLMATNIMDALDRGYDITETGLFKKNYRSPVDTIYFLSDGAPTSGRYAKPELILESILYWNRARKIRIHVIHIQSAPGEEGGGGPGRGGPGRSGPGRGGPGRGGRGGGGRFGGGRNTEKFMKELARRTGGRYVRPGSPEEEERQDPLEPPEKEKESEEDSKQKDTDRREMVLPRGEVIPPL
jgi:hypothetical protein